MIRGDIKTQLLSEFSKIPEKGSINSAGYDLTSIEEFELKPMERHLFKTGLKMSIPIGMYGRIAPRSGLAFKNGIDVLAGVIDSDYRGEIGVLLINLSSDSKKISIGDKIAQIIFESYNDFRIVSTDNLDSTERSEGGFGSTDKTPIIADPILNLYQKAGGVPIRKKYIDEVRERQGNE